MKRNVFNSVVMGSVLLGLTEVGASSLSYEKQIAAVKQSYYAIQKIGNSDKKVQLDAVKQDARAIKYIENQDKEVQLAVVMQRYHTIGQIKDPCNGNAKLVCTNIMWNGQ